LLPPALIVLFTLEAQSGGETRHGSEEKVKYKQSHAE
jgi:hypothetical protein